MDQLSIAHVKAETSSGQTGTNSTTARAAWNAEDVNSGGNSKEKHLVPRTIRFACESLHVGFETPLLTIQQPVAILFNVLNGFINSPEARERTAHMRKRRVSNFASRAVSAT